MRFPVHASIAVVAILLVSCGPSALTFGDLQYLRKGMSVDSVDDVLPIDRTRSFTIAGKYDYEVHAYPLLTAQVTTTTSSGGGYNGFGGYSAPVTTTTTQSYTNSFYLIYRGARLRYWGMMGEIQKSEDLEMQEFAPLFFTTFQD